MRIIPVKYGESVLPESMVFHNGAKDVFRPIVFIVYLIELFGRLVLVDAGCETMPGFEMKNFVGTVKALENMGISADDITDVIITHSHHDHIECVKYFKNTLIHIQKDEYESGKEYLSDELKINIFENEYTLDNIRILKIGGHSKGSCIVEVDKKYIIAGDECYVRECLERKIPTGISCCPQKSKAFIDEYSKNKYTVLLCHDY